jgi:hypothetical protein
MVVNSMASIEGAIGGAFVGLFIYGVISNLWHFEPHYRDGLIIILVFAAIGAYLF